MDFVMRRLVTVAALEKNIGVSLDRVRIEATDKAVRAVFTIATQEEDIALLPDNWLTRLGERWQRWKKIRGWHCSWKEVWAVTKYPELDAPDLGKKFVHLEVRKDPEKKSPPADDARGLSLFVFRFTPFGLSRCQTTRCRCYLYPERLAPALSERSIGSH